MLSQYYNNQNDLLDGGPIMKAKYNLILSAEASFARRVTLAEVITRPINPWLQVIPGMFIFDFLKRTSEIRRFTSYYLYPRRLALDLSMNSIQGQQREQGFLNAEEKIKAWLESTSLYSPPILQAYITITHNMVDHYIQLLHSNGNTYYDLVKGAYKTLVSYNAFLDQLTANERDLEKAVRETLGDDDLTKRITKQRQVEEQRTKEIHVIF
jgi:hypothetical protein